MSEFSVETVGITHAQWTALEDFIAESLLELHKENTPRYAISIMIYEFGKSFDLLAMYGWLKFAKSRNLKTSAILTQIMHDLNGRKTDPKIFDPRTSGYREYADLP